MLFPCSSPFYEVILGGEIKLAEVSTEFGETVLQKDVECAEIGTHEGVVDLVGWEEQKE